MNKTTLTTIAFAVFITLGAASIAHYFQHDVSLSSFLNNVYARAIHYRWQISSTLMLVWGMWNTIVKKRIKRGFTALCIALLLAFLMPYLWPDIQNILQKIIFK